MLKVLMIRKNLSDKQKALAALREKDAEFKKREKELETAIEEVETEEERTAVQEEIEAFESDKEKHEEAKSLLEREVQELEDDLKEKEKEQSTETPEGGEEHEEEREEVKPMVTRAKFFGMTRQEQTEFMQNAEVKAFLGEIRSAIKERRTITGVGKLIPQVGLGLLREIVEDYSKVYKHVDVRRISGEGRLIIEGTIPEAVWTEMCANLNELDLTFDDTEIDGFKVGGYFKVCNAILEDSEIDLAKELFDVLGKAIALALDKAMLYGTGTKMPTGVVTALSKVESTPNIVSHAASVTGNNLWKALVKDSGLASSKYSNSEMTWFMNKATHTELVAESLAVNAAGAIVAGINNTMPVVGGTIEELNFIPDNVIIAGHFDMYLLAERAGVELSTSEHAFWVADMTGFKGTARYDGKPLENSAFVVIGINGKTPTATEVTFASDSANN